jgi:hypothetical protein
MNISPNVIAYFWSRVDKGDGCWLWQGPARTAEGYGDVAIRNPRPDRSYAFRELAHRVSWVLAFGQIPGGLSVLHRCDTPACVNPSHLFLGTRADNNRDKQVKGRAYRPAGAAHGEAKLTDAQVIEIRRRRAAGERGTDLAAEFGVSPSLIHLIHARKAWKHL